MMNATQILLQDRLEEAILCADDREIIRAIEEGANIEVQPRSEQFREKISPDDDRPLSIIARVTFSHFATNQSLRMCLELEARKKNNATMGSVHDLVRKVALLRDMESRWDSVQRLVFRRQGGALWDRLPHVFDTPGMEEMTTVEHLFKDRPGFIAERDRTLIDNMVDRCLIDSNFISVSFPESTESSMKICCTGIDNFLAVANMAMCRDAIEATAVRALIADSDKGFMMFGAVASRLGQLSQGAAKIIDDVRCVIEKDNYPVLASTLIKRTETAIDPAQFYDANHLLQIMLDAGCEPNDHSSIHDRSLLMLAAKYERRPAIALLLGAGADPTAKDKRNHTVLSHLGKTNTSEEAQAIRRLIKAHAARKIMVNIARQSNSI
jgi:hypothetical protein